MSHQLSNLSVGLKAIVKLARMGGVAKATDFTPAEARRLAKADDYTRVSRFTTGGPVMIEIHAAGWVKANTHLSAYI